MDKERTEIFIVARRRSVQWNGRAYRGGAQAMRFGLGSNWRPGEEY